MLLGIVLLLQWSQNIDLRMRFTMVEYFSGRGNVNKTFRQDPGHRAASFELLDSPAMNICTAPGLAPLV